MEKDENIAAHDKRRLQVYADDEDVLVRVLGIPEADYECMLVNGPWPEKSLLEGDIVLCAPVVRDEARREGKKAPKDLLLRYLHTVSGGHT